MQGVGFRPFVYVTAAELGLAGSVSNTAAGVVVEVEGDAGRRGRVRPAAGRRRRRRWPRSRACTRPTLPSRGGTGFTIERLRGRRPGRTLASPDVAICDDCLAELRDPADRRYRHPFITCTNCGPRFTIITALPYDRAATTMAGFAMCAACRGGVRRPGRPPLPRPADRLPRLRADGSTLVGPGRARVPATDAVAGARELLADGRIVAVKGLGGYHLACDATQRGRRSPSCAAASSAATSRSR